MIENFDNTNIQSFEYETTINSDGNIIGTCELGNSIIQMLNNSNEYSSLKGQWIKTIHGSFYIHSVEPVQEKVNIKLSCYDVKYKLDTLYDSSLYTFPLTLKEWRNQIGTNCGIIFDNSDFPNSNLILNKEPYLGDNPSNRNVISIIAQAGCSWVDVDKDDIFYFNWFNTKNHNVNDWLELTTEKEKTFPINVVVLGRGDVEENVKWPKNLPENPIEFRIDNNYILDPQDDNEDKRYEVIQPIYDRVNGFSNLLFKIRTQDINNKLSIRLGDLITYKDIWNNTLTANVMSKKITYLGGDFSKDDNYEITLSAEELKETTTEYSYASSVENRILKVERKTDKQSGEISDIITEQTKQNDKISSVTQNVNEINNKISDIADITISQESNNGTLSFTKINRSQPIGIVIRPIGDNIKYLYPSETLYPNDDLLLKERKVRFTNIITNQIVDYEIPDDLLYYDSDNYDEFILDYNEKKCLINKKVGYNSEGNISIINNPIIMEYPYPKIELTDGDYIVELLGYDKSYIFAKLMAQNAYTTQFATKAEMSSEINQTAESINLKVEEKLDDKEFTGANIMLEINNDTSFATINAEKISLNGKNINLTSEDITINSDNFAVDKNGNVKLSSNRNRPTFSIEGKGFTGENNILKMMSDGLNIYNKDNEELFITRNSKKYIDGQYYDNFHLEIKSSYGTSSILSGGDVTVQNSSGYTKAGMYGDSGIVECVSLYQSSRAEEKKNFEKLENALDIINKVDIYKYNFKDQEDTEKKHIGFVIGEKYNYSEEMTSNDNRGVDIYSMVSVCFKAIQEQQLLIEELNNKITELESDK